MPFDHTVSELRTHTRTFIVKRRRFLKHLPLVITLISTAPAETYLIAYNMRMPINILWTLTHGFRIIIIHKLRNPVLFIDSKQ
ncbi:MAG: hypothetical protein K9N48_03325 [Verrucomicrobia bacterium]|nr:hypothetical protein [Verrucomicrobiota bacterium]MCF7708170.1 hypothetical protein [Verrucomicrobiota bacterium]